MADRMLALTSLIRPQPSQMPSNPYLAFGLRWWWLLVLCAILGLAIGLAYLRYGPIPYTSTSLLLVTPQGQSIADATSSPGSQRANATSYAAQLASAPIYELVSRAMADVRKISPTDLALMVQTRKIDVRPQSGTNVISIGVTDSDPDFAARLADTFATVFVDDVARQAREELAARRQQLEGQIQGSQLQVTAAQLAQREIDLRKDLGGYRTQLLQLQLQYQQEMQRQALDQRLTRIQQAQAGGGQQAAIDQTAVQELDEVSAQARAQSLEALQQQQQVEQDAIAAADQQIAQIRRNTEQAVSSLSSQLGQVRAQLAQAGPDAPVSSGGSSGDEGAPPATIDQQLIDVRQRIADLQQEQAAQEVIARQLQTQRTRLQQQEQALVGQVTGARSNIEQLQGQIQAERQRQVQIQQQARIAPAANLTKEQKRALERQQADAERSASAAMSVSEDTVALLENRIREAQRGLAETNRQLADVRQQVAGLPPEPEAMASVITQRRIADLQEQQRQLEQQQRSQETSSRDASTRRTSLGQREQDLVAQINAQRLQGQQREQDAQNAAQTHRVRLLQLQAQYQQEVQRNAQADKQEAVSAQREVAQANATGAQTPSGPSDEEQQNAATARLLQDQWLQIIGQQIRDVQANIDTTTAQLNQVIDAKSRYPVVATDPAAGAAPFLGAYSDMLQSLTRDYVRLQLNSQSFGLPVVKYGDASDPISVVSLRRVLAISIVCGLIAGAALAYLLDLLRQRRALAGLGIDPEVDSAVTLGAVALVRRESPALARVPFGEVLLMDVRVEDPRRMPGNLVGAPSVIGLP